jgi:methyl-accepting chemotaxis protein
MKRLFWPAEVLMNRLSYPLKFSVVGLLVLLAFAALMLTITEQFTATISRSQSELIAADLSRPLSTVVELTQQHRGLSARVLGGDAAALEQQRLRAQDVDAALEKLNVALDGHLLAQRQWQSIQTAWLAIERQGSGWSRERNFEAHTVLIDNLLRFQTLFADAYGLTFDPEPETYYLMTVAVNRLPFLLERLARLRGLGSGILAQGQLNDRERSALIILSAETKAAMRGMEDSIAKVVSLHPELREQLELAMTILQDKNVAVGAVVDDVVYQGDFEVVSAERFFAMTTETINIGYEQMHRVFLPQLDALLNQRIANAERVYYLNLAIFLLLLAIVGYLSVGAWLSVLGSIHTLRSGSARLASGDLTARIDLAARDELRFVAGSFNEMAETMGHLIGRIKGNSEQVADSAHTLAAATGQIRDASQNQSDAASSMAAAVEQMTVGIEQIAHNAGKADSLANRSGELSREGGKLVGAVVEDISEIAQSVANSARSVEELGERSEQIGTIVAVISGIAAQTNLLALNAAIEAARAGEQGRGFAVVADEVRKLAERTANSTEEIGAMVKAIQEGTQVAVKGMERGVLRVNEGVMRARQTGEAMDEINAAANQVMSTVVEISSALREQSAASAEIAEQVNMIARMAEENDEAVGSNHQTASRLGDLADTLRQNVSHFKAN